MAIDPERIDLRKLDVSRRHFVQILPEFREPLVLPRLAPGRYDLVLRLLWRLQFLAPLRILPIRVHTFPSSESRLLCRHPTPAQSARTAHHVDVVATLVHVSGRLPSARS